MNIWEGIYSKFSDVLVKGTGHSEKDMINGTINLINSAIFDGRNNTQFSSDILNHVFLAFLVSTQIMNKKDIIIVDFGGGLGIGYVSIKKMLHLDFLLNYNVIEDNRITEIGKNLWKNDNNINFYSEIPKLNNNPDIVYISSALQYIENYKNIISKLCEYNSNFILFSKFSAVKCKTYITSQRNIPGTVIPYIFINETELIEILNSFNYNLVLKTNASRGYDQSNFSEEQRMDRTSDFLFAKKL